ILPRLWFPSPRGISLDFSPRVSEGGAEEVAEKLVGAVILSPYFGRRTPAVYSVHRPPRTAGVLREVYPERQSVVYSVHRPPRTAGVLRFAQDDSIEASFRNL